MKTPKWLSIIDVSLGDFVTKSSVISFQFPFKAISNRVKQSRSMKKPYINSISCKFLNLGINNSKKWLRVYMHYALQYIVTGFIQIALETLRSQDDNGGGRMRRFLSIFIVIIPTHLLCQM